MFHHFHNEKIHKKSQGSISKDELFDIIKFIGRENILNAEDFYHRYKENKLKNNNVCLTFDDGIKCQYDIALPLLEELNIKAFFFVYSSLFKKKADMLEIYRYFRMNFFENINDFYKKFYYFLDYDLNNFFNQNSQKIKLIKIKYGYYTIEDIKFRLVRDVFLNKEEYTNIMLEMFKEYNFDPIDVFDNIFFDTNNLIQIKSLGHIIGLHSHTHPTLLEKLTFDEQFNEYNKNREIISNILKIKKSEIKFMSHPCGSYNYNTIQILNSLGIKLGFKNIINVEPEKGMKKINNSNLEIARQDHALVMKMMN